MISLKRKKLILNNNGRITKYLSRNRKHLHKSNACWSQEEMLSDEEKIFIPSDCVRTVKCLSDKYHLETIIVSDTIRSNISYLLQTADFYDYFFNNFYLYGPVKTIFIKNSILNLFSIFEALILSFSRSVCSPQNCNKKDVCELHFTKNERGKIVDALSKMKAIGIIHFDDNEMSRIKEIISLRNEVHLLLAKGNEFWENKFNMDLYYEIRKLLEITFKAIYKHRSLYFCKEKQIVKRIDK
ncbi:hypothetical protein J6Z19_09175 [bacterium]|nr:hypothetical protein [bacterium]